MKNTREIADEIRLGLKASFEGEHDSATLSRALINASGNVVLKADAITEKGVAALSASISGTGIPFCVTGTLSQDAESVTLIDDSQVPTGSKVVVTGFTAKVDGSDEWQDADVVIGDSDSATFATIPASVLTDGAIVHPSTTDVTLGDGWFDGGGAGNGLVASLSETESNGSPVFLKVSGILI